MGTGPVTTVFLRRPAGVAIRTSHPLDEQFGLDLARAAAGDSNILTITNERGHTVLIPTDNIASIEVNRG
jgi:hypothetical protein